MYRVSFNMAVTNIRKLAVLYSNQSIAIAVHDAYMQLYIASYVHDVMLNS